MLLIVVLNRQEELDRRLYVPPLRNRDPPPNFGPPPPLHRSRSSPPLNLRYNKVTFTDCSPIHVDLRAHSQGMCVCVYACVCVPLCCVSIGVPPMYTARRETKPVLDESLEMFACAKILKRQRPSLISM
jgi:hypothetical protein